MPPERPAAREHSELTVNFIESGLHAAISRGDFDTAIAPNVNDVMASMDECLAAAGIKDDQVDIIILTGGPTQTPLFQKMIRARFPDADISEEERMASVAIGLGHDARRVFK